MKMQKILEAEETRGVHQWNPTTKRVFEYLSNNLGNCFANVAARPNSVVLHDPGILNNDYSDIFISKTGSLIPLLRFSVFEDRIELTFFQNGVQTLGNMSLGGFLVPSTR